MGSDAGRREHGLGQRLRGLPRVQQAILGAGAIAAALAAVLGLGVKVVDVFDGGDGAAEVGEISGVVLRDRNLTRKAYCRRYLERVEQQRCLDGPGLDDRGNLFLVSVKVSGYEGRCCRLEWTIYQDGTKLPRFSDRLAVSNVRSPDERDWPIWVPNPPREGDFQAVFDLYDQDGHQDDRASDTYPVG